MRNMKLVDAVIQLHDIARLVSGELGQDNVLAQRIRLVADDIHVYSINSDRAEEAAKEFLERNLK